MNKILSKKIWSVLSILVVLVVLDQLTKQLAVKHLKDIAPINYLNGMFQLLYAENPGAFLGMGGDMSSTTRFVIFGLFVAIGLAIMFWSIMKNKISQNETIAYSFILAGGIGNVIDRLTHSNGHVIDFMFIDLKFAPLARTGVFNVADIAIVIGVLMLLFQTKKTVSSSMT